MNQYWRPTRLILKIYESMIKKCLKKLREITIVTKVTNCFSITEELHSGRWFCCLKHFHECFNLWYRKTLAH